LSRAQAKEDGENEERRRTRKRISRATQGLPSGRKSLRVAESLRVSRETAKHDLGRRVNQGRVNRKM